jgi:hypothetical protein
VRDSILFDAWYILHERGLLSIFDGAAKSRLALYPYKHEVGVQRDAAGVVALLASGGLAIATWTCSRLVGQMAPGC